MNQTSTDLGTTKVMSVVVPEALHREFKAHCVLTDISIQDGVRLAFRNFIDSVN